MSTTADSDYVLGYWDIKGLAAPIRMAFAYSGIAYRDELYAITEVEGKWRSGWPAKAKELIASADSAFPNLPYLVVPARDGSPRTVSMQSGAILRYVARLGGLMGDGELEALQVDELLEQVMDMRNEMVRLVYSAEFKDNHEAFAKQSLPYYFGAFEKYLHNRMQKTLSDAAAEDTPLYYVGAKISVADLAIQDVVSVATALAGSLLDVATLYPLVSRHVGAVRQLPQLQQYFDGPLGKLAPNNRMACWGNSPIQ